VLAALEADARAAGRARVAAFPEVAAALLEAPSAPLPQAISEARPPAPPSARRPMHPPFPCGARPPRRLGAAGQPGGVRARWRLGGGDSGGPARQDLAARMSSAEARAPGAYPLLAARPTLAFLWQ